MGANELASLKFDNKLFSGLAKRPVTMIPFHGVEFPNKPSQSLGQPAADCPRRTLADFPFLNNQLPRKPFGAANSISCRLAIDSAKLMRNRCFPTWPVSDLEVGLQEPARVRSLARRYLFRCAGHHDFATSMSPFGAEINDVIGGLDHIKVMLDQ